MFVRGGVYVVVRDAMGPFVARVSVSALLFDYVLTGPISSVSAGQYLGRLVNEVGELLHLTFRTDPAQFAIFFAILVTMYFWWYNIKGLHESSTKALRIMQLTTVMVVIFLVWCILTLLIRGPAQYPPAPLPRNLQFSDEGLGWFKGTWWPTIPGRRGHHRVRTFRAVDERIRNAGAGLSGDRISEAQEPEAGRQHRVHLCSDFDRRDHSAGVDDHSGCCSKELCRESARRSFDASGRAGASHGWLSRIFVVIVGVLILVGRSQHVDHRSEWRHEPSGRRRRARSVVPEAASRASVRRIESSI